VLALAFLVVVAALFFGGLWARRRRGVPATSAFRTTLFILAAGTGTAIVGSAVPLYVILLRGVRGGSIEANLPPGISEDVLLNLVIVGAGITIVAAVGRYLDHLDS